LIFVAQHSTWCGSKIIWVVSDESEEEKRVSVSSSLPSSSSSLSLLYHHPPKLISWEDQLRERVLCEGFKGKIGDAGGQFRPQGLAEAKGEHGYETFLLGNKFLAGVMQLYVVVGFWGLKRFWSTNGPRSTIGWRLQEVEEEEDKVAGFFFFFF
jgi:hypothetical protein